jgi:hypothetical protein
VRRIAVLANIHGNLPAQEIFRWVMRVQQETGSFD